MPSVRLSFLIHQLAPGHAPEEVLDTARAVAETFGHYESHNITIKQPRTAPVPQLSVRISLAQRGPELAETSHALAQAVAAELAAVAQISQLQVVPVKRR